MEASESNGVAALTPGKSPESAWNGTLRWERTDGQCNLCPAGGGSALWATPAIRSTLPFLLQASMSLPMTKSMSLALSMTKSMTSY